MSTYELLDSGESAKLERFGDLTLIRPAFQALWKREKPKLWMQADASFTREKTKEGWHFLSKNRQDSFSVEMEDILFKLKLTPFGHIGLFPEHAFLWKWVKDKIKASKKTVKVLNLFAYTGGATLACAQAGAEVTHLDAAKGIVTWARENAKLNGLENHPIRWIVDDVSKFLQREKKRGSFYDAIIMDPPTFGRGASGEVFKIEKDLYQLLELSYALLSKKPCFFLFSTHTPGLTPLVLQQLLDSMPPFKGECEAGELFLKGKQLIPSGCYAAWV